SLSSQVLLIPGHLGSLHLLETENSPGELSLSRKTEAQRGEAIHPKSHSR
ncbi:hypothetical protein H8958_007354, partial [Nasalis larvatus]